MSSRRVVITGLGLLSPVGNEVENSWQNLLSGPSPVRPITYFDTKDFDFSFIKNLSLEDGAATLMEFTTQIIIFSLKSEGKFENQIILLKIQ